MYISIIIPTLNEEENIKRLLNYLTSLPHQHFLHEIIVSDGGSKDDTVSQAQRLGAKVIRAPSKGRAVQMNFGSEKANGDILYFVHADVLPPKSCLNDIVNAIQSGHCMGCFAYDFDSDSTMLKLNAFLTTFNWLASGGGDQTFYIPKKTFEELDRFDENLPIMEDFEFVKRAKKKYPFHLLPQKALVSARKYEHNHYLKVQIVNILVFGLFKMGVSPYKLAKWYRYLLF